MCMTERELIYKFGYTCMHAYSDACSKLYELLSDGGCGKKLANKRFWYALLDNWRHKPRL